MVRKNVNSIKGINHPSKEPDEKTSDELQSLESMPEFLFEKINQEKAITEKLHEDIACLKDDRSARKTYGKGIAIFVASYIGIIILLLVFHSFLTLSDKVLIAALSTTSINIIGLLTAVVRYLFPRRDGVKS